MAEHHLVCISVSENGKKKLCLQQSKFKVALEQ